MAVNEMVTDVIAESAFKQVSQFRVEMRLAVSEMVEFSKAGKAAFADLGGAKSIIDLTNATKASTEANKGAVASLTDYKKAVTETDTFLDQFSSTMKENIKLYVAQQSQLKQIKHELDEAKKAYGENSAQVHKLVDEQMKLKAQTAETRIAITAENKERIAAIGSIDELAQRVGRLKDNFRALSAAERDSAEGKEMLTQIQAMDTELKKANASLGNFHGNVGNYPNPGAEFKAITTRMVELKLAGQDTSDEFKELTGRARELKSAMGGVGSEIKETAKDTQSLSSKIKDWAKGLLAAAAAYLSFQTVKQVITDSIEEISQADEAAGRLKNTLESYNNIGAFNRLAAQADEFAEKLGYLDNDDLNEVFNQLLTYGKLTEDQMNDLLPLIIDFAAKEKISVTDASETIIKALEGNGKALKVYGIDIKDAADETEKAASPSERLSLIMKELKPRVEGAAVAFGGTLPGMMAKLKQSIANLEESFGRFLEKLSGVEQQQLDNAIAAGKEAREAEKLVSEYETLSTKVDQTADDKKRLGEITTTLTGIFGDSVVEINKETGAITLNLEATRALIKQKLLLNNQKAVEQAGLYDAAEQKRKENADGLTKAQLLYNDALKRTGITMEQINGKLRQGKSDRLQELTPGEAEVFKLFQNVQRYKDGLDQYLDAKIKAADELRKLGFQESDVDSLFNPNKKIDQRGGGNDSDKKPVKDNRLKNEKEQVDQALRIREAEIKVQQIINQAIVDDYRSTYQERIAAQQEYNSLQKQLDEEANTAQVAEVEATLNEIDRIKKIKVADRTQEQTDLLGREDFFMKELLRIDAAYEVTKIETAKKTSDSIVTIQKNEIEKRLALITEINQNMDSQEAAAQLQLKKQYDEGVINFETYTKAKEKLDRDFQLARLLAQKAYLEAEIEAIKAIDPNADVSKLTSAISKIDIAINNLISNAKKADATLKGLLKQLKDQAAESAISIAKSEMEKYYASQIANQERVLENIQTQRDAQLSAVDDMMLSEDKKAEKRKEINAQAQALEKQQLKEIADIKRKQAIADRTAAILEITAKTAIAALHQAGSGDPYTAFARTAAVIGIGLAQVAAVLAKPLPEYGDGTENHPGGLAVLGDKGEKELVKEPGKAPYWSEDTRTLYNLAAGTQVIPKRMIPEHELIAAQMGFMTPRMLQNIHAGNDFTRLEQVTTKGFAEMTETIKNKREVYVNLNNSGIVKITKAGNSWFRNINSKA